MQCTAGRLRVFKTKYNKLQNNINNTYKNNYNIDIITKNINI